MITSSGCIDPWVEFEPDAAQAARFDRQIHDDLAASLDHLRERCHPLLPLPAAALEAMAHALRAGVRFGPAAFGLYASLVFSLLQDDHARALDQFEALVALQPLPHRFEILSLSDPRLAAHRQRFIGLMDFGIAGGPVGVSLEQLQAFRDDHRWAMDRLQRDLPELAAEIAALVSQLILIAVPEAGPEDAAAQVVFDGGSSPMLWGAMVINASRHRSRLELLEVLVHESAHLLLYAHAQHEPLVLNDGGERYPSPLRQDPRPMDGLFHATWVSARMAYAMARLSRSSSLEAALRRQALLAAQQHRVHVAAGLAGIRAHALLTETGRRLIDAAEAAMAPARLGVDPVA